MLRYYETTDNLGGAFVNTLLFVAPVTMLDTPDPQFDIVSGYTNTTGDAGQLTVTNNEMVFNNGSPITPTVIGEYVLFNTDNTQQIVVDVTDVITISTTTLSFVLSPIVNDLFNVISTQNAIDGVDRYRCISIRNDDATLSFQNGKIWISGQVSEGLVSIGFDPTGVNGTPTTTDGETVPTGVVFTAPVSEVAGITIPTLNANDHIFLWIKRTNIAGASQATFRATFEISGAYV